jgi:glycosyltransferase involved in cell wall biosynthesis
VNPAVIKPQASIIITTHNRPHLLPRAIESARLAGTDLEIIVVDDASDDNTAEVCRSFNGNVKYVRVDRNQGVAGARNIGLLASQGDFVSFLDDDDTRLPGSMNKQLAMLRQEPNAGLIYAQTIIGDQDGHTPRGITPEELPQGDLFFKLLARNFIPCGSVVFRRACLSAVGLLDDSISGPDDWDFWIRVAEIYPIIALEEPVGVWRQSNPASGQGTSNIGRLVSLGIKQFGKWMKLPRMAGVSRKTKRALWLQFSDRMAARLIWDSVRALRLGRLGQVIGNLATIPRLHPLALPKVLKTRVMVLSWKELHELWNRAA